MTDREKGGDADAPVDDATVDDATVRDDTAGGAVVHRHGLRRLALVGARSTAGLLGLGIAAAIVLAATWLPIPTVGVGTTSSVVTPAAAIQQRICPGPILRLGDVTGRDATTAISLGRPDIEFASTNGTPTLESLTTTANPSNAPSQRLALPPSPAGEAPGLLAGSQSQYVTTGDFVGFAATDCAAPTSENWLVGGSTVTGRTTLIEINNPTNVGSVVNLTVYSEAGRVDAAGLDGILVPAGSQRILSLAGFAPDITSPVVHVVSKGGRVTAHLQETIVRTLDPGGIELFGATTRPSTTTVIPGIVIVDQKLIGSAARLDGYQDIGGVLRILVPGDPGDPPSSVTVAVAPEDGTSEATEATITVNKGSVVDVPLGHFPAGTYTMTVTSEVPAVAAVRASTVTLAAGATTGTDASGEAVATVAAADVAWFVGAPELQERALVSVPVGPSPHLHLVNTGSSDTVITIDTVIADTTAATNDGTEGAGNTVTVAAGKTVAVPVTAGKSYLLAGFDSLRLAVSYHGEGKIAGFVADPQERLAQAVTVYHRFG